MTSDFSLNQPEEFIMLTRNNLASQWVVAKTCFSLRFSKHEERVGKIAMEMGFKHVSLSSKVMPMVKIVPRGYTSCVDAYLTPCIQNYVSSFQSGFDGDHLNALFMQSDGGLTRMEKYILCLKLGFCHTVCRYSIVVMLQLHFVS